MTTAPYWQIEAATLDWQPQADGGELPVSRRFGDVYFSRDNGLAETRHVFLHGNDLPARLAALQPGQRFVVGETGFGTGLNLLALWQLWQQVRPDNGSQLHFVSVECFPLQRADLQRALAQWPELAPLSAQLLAQYPPLLAGVHRLVFVPERLTVDLCWGEASQVLPELAAPRPSSSPPARVDAWFLDGFAPACNPALWQDRVFAPMLALSGPGTTFASFSVAGVVKQGLRAHGITVTRPPGFGRKREMLRAWWPLPPQTSPAPTRLPQRIAVVGAGIAGLSVVDSLLRRGHRVSLFEKTQPLAGASGNPRALLVPKLTVLSQVSHHLATSGWLATLRWWQARAPDVVTCRGARLLDTVRQPLDHDRLSQYPTEVVQPLAPEAGDRPAAWLPDGAFLHPARLAAEILQQPGLQLVTAEVVALSHSAGGWTLQGAQGQVWDGFDQVVVCTALQAAVLCPGLPELRPVRGQVSWVPCAEGPTHLLSYGGYAGPVEDQLLLGASFVRGDAGSDLRVQDHAHNLARLQEAAPALAARLPGLSQWQGRASVRAQTRNYQPVLGPAPAGTPGLWVLTGLGSKGYSYAPLGAEALCALMLGEPAPLPATVLQSLGPGRG